MAKSQPKYLRLHAVEEPPADLRANLTESAALARIADSVQLLTGGNLRYEHGSRPIRRRDLLFAHPVAGVDGRQLGQVVLSSGLRRPDSSGDTAIGEQLVIGIAEILSELMHAQDALWRREAELATGVPVTPHREESAHLAARLEAILAAGVEAIGGQAAGLYLLDGDTSHLKLRSCFGLPRGRLADSPRLLAGAMADLEALLGNAIVLTDRDQFGPWNAPEQFAAAVCLPISTPTVPLGTVWFFADQAHDYSSRETGLLEIVAGRLAAELEREALLADAVAMNRCQREIAALVRLQHDQLPQRGPLIDDWDVAGWTRTTDQPLGSFHDWAPLAEHAIGFFVGEAAIDRAQRPPAQLPAAITAVTLRATVRALAQEVSAPGLLLTRANRSLWSMSTGDQSASLLAATVSPASGKLQLATAGSPAVLVLTPGGGWRSHSRMTLSLGADPDTVYLDDEIPLEPGQVLVVLTESACAGENPGPAVTERQIAEQLSPRLDCRARELVDIAQALVIGPESQSDAAGHASRGSLLIFKRVDRRRR